MGCRSYLRSLSTLALFALESYLLSSCLFSSHICEAFVNSGWFETADGFMGLSQIKETRKFGGNSFSTSGSHQPCRAVLSMDYYDVLGVSKSASDSDIKKAFRKKARQYHPDSSSGDASTEKFQEIQKAYEILSDPSNRQRYDQFGEAGVRGSGMGGGGAGVEVDLSDIFESFFGGGMGGGGGGRGRGGGRRSGPVVGDDLRFDLDVDFKTAVFGGEEKVRIRHLETCETCTGSGAKPGTSPRTCTTCGGIGIVTQAQRTPFGAFQTQTQCSTCRGTGEMITEYCGTCSGRGVQEKTKQVRVNIPAGVETGNKLRIRGEGDAGQKGGPAGDLYIFLSVKSHPYFKREGSDIYLDTAISYVDAGLGCKMRVDTVDGDVEVTVPPGTQPGTVLRLRGKGAPRLGNKDSRGDQYLTVKVEVPANLGVRERELLEELRRVRGVGPARESQGAKVLSTDGSGGNASGAEARAEVSSGGNGGKEGKEEGIGFSSIFGGNKKNKKK